MARKAPRNPLGSSSAPAWAGDGRTLLRPPPPELPPDVRLMNGVSTTVLALAGLAVAALALLALARSPWFPVRSIELQGQIERTRVEALRTHAAPVLAGNFFSLDLQRSQAAFEAVPWVRKAVVRRVWPDRLAVHLEEHRVAALWQAEDGADRLVNTHGEVFEASLSEVDDDTLPVLSGPEGSSAEMLAVYEQIQASLLRLRMNIYRLQLSSRGSWRAELDTGAVLELGRGGADELLARTERFVDTLEQATGTLQAPLEYVDLRHRNGYAMRLRGISVTAAAAADQRRPAVMPRLATTPVLARLPASPSIPAGGPRAAATRAH